MVYAEVNLGGLLWSLLTAFFMVVYLIILFSIVVDLFRDHEQSGLAKAAWVVFFFVLPLLSVIVYLIVRGDGMARRAAASARTSDAAFQQQVREATGSAPADQIARAKALHDDGVINDEEFETLKQKALASQP